MQIAADGTAVQGCQIPDVLVYNRIVSKAIGYKREFKVQIAAGHLKEEHHHHRSKYNNGYAMTINDKPGHHI